MDKTISLSPGRRNLIAGVLVLTGAVCFSAKAVIIKIAYQYEIDSVSLLTLRMLFSLPFYLFIVTYATRRLAKAYRPPSRKDIGIIILLGVLGYYLASLFDFLGLQYISASLERVLLFIYPTLVVILSAIFLGKPITRNQLLALLLTYAGIAIVFSESLSMPENDQFLLGAGLILLGALAYAVYLMGSGSLLPRIGTWRFTSYAMMAAAGAVIIHHGLQYRWALFHFPAEVYGLALLMAFLSTVLPSFLISEGIRVIGAGNAAIIGSVSPISTIILANIFLGERLGSLQWIGTFVVIIGVLLVTLQKQRED